MHTVFPNAHAETEFTVFTEDKELLWDAENTGSWSGCMWEHSDALHSEAQRTAVCHLDVGETREGESAAGNGVSLLGKLVLKQLWIFRIGMHQKINIFDNMTHI